LFRDSLRILSFATDTLSFTSFVLAAFFSTAFVATMETVSTTAFAFTNTKTILKLSVDGIGAKHPSHGDIDAAGH